MQKNNVDHICKTECSITLLGQCDSDGALPIQSTPLMATPLHRAGRSNDLKPRPAGSETRKRGVVMKTHEHFHSDRKFDHLR